MTISPFRLPRRTPFGLIESFLESATGLSKLDALYQKRPLNLPNFDFMKHTLDALHIDYNINGGSLNNIPKTGPVVVVANHPLGAIEGVILAALIANQRQDIQVLANEMLKRIPEIADLFIGVDVFGGKNANNTNRRAIQTANKHLANGGLLIMFPAGEVSSYPKGSKQLADIQWRNSVAKFVAHSKATSVPIFIDGKNSSLFYQAGRVHPLLRTALLGRELLNKKGSSIGISIASPISYSDLRHFEKDDDLVNHLRQQTYVMSTEKN